MFQNSLVSLKDMTKRTLLPQIVLQLWEKWRPFFFFSPPPSDIGYVPHATINTDPIRDPCWVWLLSIDLPSPVGEETLQAHQLLRHSSNPLDQAVAAEGASLAFLPFRAFWLSVLLWQWLLDIVQGGVLSVLFIEIKLPVREQPSSCWPVVPYHSAFTIWVGMNWLISEVFECYLQICFVK